MSKQKVKNADLWAAIQIAPGGTMLQKLARMPVPGPVLFKLVQAIKVIEEKGLLVEETRKALSRRIAGVGEEVSAWEVPPHAIPEFEQEWRAVLSTEQELELTPIGLQEICIDGVILDAETVLRLDWLFVNDKQVSLGDIAA